MLYWNDLIQKSVLRTPNTPYLIAYYCYLFYLKNLRFLLLGFIDRLAEL
jgi:hypothetical protein